MRILWYNTWCLPWVTSTTHVERVAEYVASACREHQVDLVGLAEVFGQGTRDVLLAALQKLMPVDFDVVSSSAGESWWGRQSSGLVVIACRWKGARRDAVHVDRIRFEAFEHSHLWDSLAAKGFFLVPVTLESGSKLTVVFTHLQNSEVGFSVAKGRATVLRQMRQMLHDTARMATASKYVVVGDLNIEPQHIPDEVLKEYGGVLHVPHVSTTIDTSQTFDYAICSSAMRDSVAVAALMADDANPSDHRALVVTLAEPTRAMATMKKEIPAPGLLAPFSARPRGGRIPTKRGATAAELNHDAYWAVVWGSFNVVVLSAAVVSMQTWRWWWRPPRGLVK